MTLRPFTIYEVDLGQFKKVHLFNSERLGRMPRRFACGHFTHQVQEDKVKPLDRVFLERKDCKSCCRALECGSLGFRIELVGQEEPWG